MQVNGKMWFTFVWAATHYPHATLIFKQDSDSIVDYRRALPAMLHPRVCIGRGELDSGRLQRLYLGRLCHRSVCPEPAISSTCAGGSFYGFSTHVVQWLVGRMRLDEFKTGDPEDMVTCRWANTFDAESSGAGKARLDREGLLFTNGEDDHWIHEVKQEWMHLRCIYDRLDGCRLNDPPHTSIPQSFRLSYLPANSSTVALWNRLSRRRVRQHHRRVATLAGAITFGLEQWRPGYCNSTSSWTVLTEGDCERHKQGSWHLTRAEAETWETAVKACITKCSRCARCHHLSVGRIEQDCSWYAKCDSAKLEQKPVGFRTLIDVWRNARDE